MQMHMWSLYFFVFNVNKTPTLIENSPLSRLLRSLTLLQFSIYVGMSKNHIGPCMRACRCICGHCTSLFTKNGCTSPEVHPNLKMLFLLIREATIICSQYSVSVTLNYAVRAFYACRLEERGLLSACLASCVLIVLFTFTFYKRNYIFIYIQYSIIIFHFFNRHPLIPLFHIFHPILHLESNHHQPVNFQ